MQTIKKHFSWYIATFFVAALVVIGYTVFVQQEPTIVAKCSGQVKVSKLDCYKKEIETIVQTRGVKSAFAQVAEAYAADPEYEAICHANTHDLGKAAYTRYKKTGAIDLTPDASFCGYGFYHGFMEEMFAQTGTLEQASAFCAYAGVSQPLPAGLAEGACYHGIGHGVTEGTEIENRGNAQKIAAPGLALCEQVAKTDDFKTRCASGVFNAVAVMYRDPINKLDAKGDPYALCGNSTYTKNQAASCFDQMNTLAVYLGQDDLAKAVAFTRTIRADDYRTIAVKAVATFYIQAAKTAHVPISASNIRNACRGQDSGVCLLGVISGILEFGEPHREYAEGLLLCGDTSAPGTFRQTCYRALIQLSGVHYSASQTQEICNAIPSEYQGSCSVVQDNTTMTL